MSTTGDSKKLTAGIMRNCQTLRADHKTVNAQTRKVGFAIGNGLSRESFDLETIRYKGITVGCNECFLDFDPDYLVSLDTWMNKRLKWMIDRNVERNFKWVTRYQNEQGKRLLTVEGLPVAMLDEVNGGFNNNSGVLAAAFLAEIIQVDVVCLIGFDFFAQVPGKKDNDIYGGNTRRSNGLVYCWNLLSERNPKTQFYRLGELPEYDLDFYKNQLKGYEYIESVDEMDLSTWQHSGLMLD